MIRAMINTMQKEKWNGGDLLHIIEFLAVAGMILFGIYNNSKDVPALKDAVNNTQTRVSVLEQGQTDLKQNLDDIKHTLGRIENRLLRGRNSD